MRCLVFQNSQLVRRSEGALVADAARVISKFFLPGSETKPQGALHVDTIMERVLRMGDEEVSATLRMTLERFGERHYQLSEIFVRHFERVSHHAPEGVPISRERRDLIGAFFTQEYAVEGVALFNPSIVPHPDQSGVLADEIRIILSLRAIGEGHVSCIEFRTGIFSEAKGLHIDEPGTRVVTGKTAPITLSRELLMETLDHHVGTVLYEELLRLLPETFDSDHLGDAITLIVKDSLITAGSAEVAQEIRNIASANYQLHFPADREISEYIITPYSADERQGVEDARFTQFIENDGTTNYYATYTAFDGAKINQHLLKTSDFINFEIRTLIGQAAGNKGMAIFPRRVNGTYLAISRWDNETISIAKSPDMICWEPPVALQFPEKPWEFIKLGNCGSPIETKEGWLLITHGVGPMREYSIGAILLDLKDPSKLIGALQEPLLVSLEDEREGYVPNVVYSCGSLLHGNTLILPYGCSDLKTRFAYVDFSGLMNQLRKGSQT
jgi:predicted GH43/DUF377 family glycosyl hydrolase